MKNLRYVLFVTCMILLTFVTVNFEFLHPNEIKYGSVYVGLSLLALVVLHPFYYIIYPRMASLRPKGKVTSGQFYSALFGAVAIILLLVALQHLDSNSIVVYDELHILLGFAAIYIISSVVLLAIDWKLVKSPKLGLIVSAFVFYVGLLIGLLYLSFLLKVIVFGMF